MKRDEFYPIVFESLDASLSKQGYSLKKSKWGWVKEIDGIRIGVFVGFWKTGPECSTILSFSVRLEDVEMLVNQYSDIDRAGWKQSSTIIFYLPEIIKYRDTAFRFYNEQELQVILNEYYTPFLNSELTHLENCCNSYENVLDLYLNANNKYHKLLENSYRNGLSIIAIAKALKRPDYENMISAIRSKFEILTQKMPGCNDTRLIDTFFEKFICDLG